MSPYAAQAVDLAAGVETPAKGKRVWLQTLRLENFRNYSCLEVELDSGLNLFHGSNGSGKTSVLEAVSYLAVARSLRGSSDTEVVKWGERGFGVGGEARSGETPVRLVLRFTRSEGKEVRVAGECLTKLSDLVGVLRVAWFSPEDTWITKGGPAERRRLLDMTLCQLDAGYLRALADYRRALRQRNEALLSWSPDEESDRIVEVWTDRLVKYGSKVIAARLAFLPLFTSSVSRAHSRISAVEALELSYRGTVLSAKGDEEAAHPAADIEDAFREALARISEDEKRRGFTLLGPHRDDLEVRLNGRLLRSFGSQGQHRTAAIALKLGEAAALDQNGQGVIVLLDDILSELDEVRAGALVEFAGEFGQALMTSTGRLPDRIMKRSTCFSVEAGEVVRE